MADPFENTDDFDVYASTGERTYKLVQFDVAQGIARLNLNRPPANVLSLDLMDELAAALESLEYERDVKLVVMTATGKYFSAGFELADHLGDRGYLMLEGFRRIFEAFDKLDKPTLAVVSGVAFGAGCILAAGCDIVLAGQSAKFGQPEVRAGVFNTVAVVLLQRLVGQKRAFEMLMSGASLSAAEAERIGLISRVVPDERLAAEMATLVQRFQEGSAPVLQSLRRAIVGGRDLPLLEALRQAEDVYLNQLMSTEDAGEGLRAILERRPPMWKDK